MRTNKSIRERLGRLPESLTQAYDEIYSQNGEKDILQRAVQWVSCAREPLTSEILLMAVRLESNLQSLTLSDPIDDSTLESICSHLVVLDSQLKVWKFPHASVAEYFENQHRSWIDQAPEEVAILLVSCLIDCYSTWKLPDSNKEIREYLELTPDFNNHLDPRHPLQRYTRKYWLQHMQNTLNQCQEATDLSEILERFLGVKGPQQSSSLQYQAWCRHMDIIDDLGYNFDYEQDLQPSEKSIFGICVLGLHKFLKGWWDKDIDVSQVNDCKLDLLAIAASYGHDELCSELISRGSDIHKGLDSEFGSALMEAIRSSQIKTVKLLLDKGANPNLVRGGHSPLCLAISWAKDLVEPLLEAGADPNMACSDCWEECALGTAARFDIINSARLLIKYGADVNLTIAKSSYGSPLGRAVFGGSLKCVKLFVENGADVNAHLGGNYGSVLAAAIFGRGKGIEMVKYLIEEAGVNPTILSSSPPRSPYIGNYLSTDRKKRAEFLINGGHVQESVLLDIGVPKEDLPNEDVLRIGRGRVYLKNIF